MLLIPSFAQLPHARLYRDSVDQQLIYVDLLEPAPVQGKEVSRWLPIPDSLAYLVGEVRFAASSGDWDAIPTVVPNQRLLPMPWASAPIFVWYHKDEAIEVVAQGTTSGFGQSNAVFNGTAPLAAMISPVLVSAELSCQAQLPALQLKAMINSALVASALGEAPLGKHATWERTVGEVFVALFEQLMAKGQITLHIERMSQSVYSTGQEKEIRQQVFVEWAHRLCLTLAPELTLASPAALFHLPSTIALPLLDLDWQPGNTIPLRTIRVLRPKSMGRSVPNR